MKDIIGYQKTLLKYARQMRRNMTKYEKILWEKIRKKQVKGIQFYRQKIIGKFIVDFYAEQIKLVIEIDGKHHLEKHYTEQDRNRDQYLNSLGILVLRFSNLDVSQQINKVMAKINKVVATQKQKLFPYG